MNCGQSFLLQHYKFPLSWILVLLFSTAINDLSEKIICMGIEHTCLPEIMVTYIGAPSCRRITVDSQSASHLRIFLERSQHPPKNKRSRSKWALLPSTPSQCSPAPHSIPVTRSINCSLRSTHTSTSLRSTTRRQTRTAMLCWCQWSLGGKQCC